MRQLNILLIVLSSLLGCFAETPLPEPLSHQDEIQFQEHVKKGIEHLDAFDRGEREELFRAKARFELAGKINASSPLPLDGLASVSVRRNNFVVARHLLLRAIKLDPSYSRAYANLAFIEEAEGNHSEAEKLLRQSVKLNPSDYFSANNLGSLLFNNGNRDIDKTEAESWFYKAQVLHPGKSSVIEKNIERTF